MARTAKSTPYHHRDLREALVASGRLLLEEKGVRGFTLRECARRAGVSHAAPAYHFASLGDLLAELARRGFVELAETMAKETARVKPDAASRLVGQCVGYIAFAAAHPMLFQLMFHGDTPHQPPLGLTDGVAAVIPHASGDVKARMADFAWSTVHGFVVLLLDGHVGASDSSRALKSRSLALLSAMAETVVRAGGVPD